MCAAYVGWIRRYIFFHHKLARALEVSGAARHRDVATTMIYTHVLNRGGRAVESPADHLFAGPHSGVSSPLKKWL